MESVSIRYNFGENISPRLFSNTRKGGRVIGLSLIATNYKMPNKKPLITRITLITRMTVFFIRAIREIRG